MAQHVALEGPVLFAYDGSEYAKAAIHEAARQLQDGRSAIVLTVWEPVAAIPFAGVSGGASTAVEEGVEQEARRIAREGATVARVLGFESEAVAERGVPVWERIVAVADERDAGLIVMGSHGRTGIGLVLLGSVAAATARHTDRPVLIAHRWPRR